MKPYLLLLLTLFTMGCNNCCDKERDDFDPYPGSKTKEKPAR